MEPDLNIWLHPHDAGTHTFSGDPDDLYLVTNPYPAPHVRFITVTQFEAEFRYPSDTPEAVLSDDEHAYANDRASLTITQDRLKAFERITQLWQGEQVGPYREHLLTNEVPSWNDLFGDLDQQELDALRPSPRHDRCIRPLLVVSDRHHGSKLAQNHVHRPPESRIRYRREDPRTHQRT